MLEDLKQLFAEFDMDLLLRPQGPDQFIFSFIALVIMGVVVFVAFRVVTDLLR